MFLLHEAEAGETKGEGSCQGSQGRGCQEGRGCQGREERVIYKLNATKMLM